MLEVNVLVAYLHWADLKAVTRVSCFVHCYRATFGFRAAIAVLNSSCVIGCKSDGEIAMKYHKLACDGGHPVGCYQAGVLRLTGEYGARQNSEEARELLKSGCDKDDSESCYFLSTLYLKPQLTGQPPISPDAQQNAFEFTKRACELNHIYACANLYQLYMKGMGCDQSEELATEAKRKAVAIRDLYERREPGVVFGEG